MKICAKCKMTMRCKTTGVIVRYGTDHCYAGDLFKCPICESEIVVTNPNPYHSTKEIHPSILIQMD